MYFYEHEKFRPKVILRTGFISLSLLVGLWLLLKLDLRGFIFIAIGFLWMPYFAEVMDMGESRKVFTIIRMIISLVLVYLFLAY
jgi:hypothetical protein